MKTILHVDMNSYFATLEQQANPFLRGRPIAIGGTGHGGVVVTASVEAKKLGVKTPIPAFLLAKTFPEVLIVEPTFAMYAHVTRQLLSLFTFFTPLVEVFSADEAFLDITQSAGRFGGPEALAYALKKMVYERIGEWVTCSIGIAPNKLLAKFASDLKKPDGLVFVSPEEAPTMLVPYRVTELCGIGPRLAKRLAAFSVRTLGDLQQFPTDVLVRTFGMHTGMWLHQAAFGQGSDVVLPFYNAPDEQSMGHQQTIRPTADRDLLLSTFLHLAEKVGRRLRRKQFRAKTVSVHVRYQSFFSEGRQAPLPHVSDDGVVLYRAARELFLDIPLLGEVRLVGITAFGLQHETVQHSLFDPAASLREEVVRACDTVNDRYGEGTVRPGRLLFRPSSKKDIPGLGFQRRFLTDAATSASLSEPEGGDSVL